MTNLQYWALLAVVYPLSRLPLRVLYCISDVLYLIVYHAVRYRRRLVRTNLSASFPEKSEAEIRDIERRFYAWFCDYIVETVKLFTISESEIRRRIRFTGTEMLDEYVRQGRSIAVYMSHYGNWEWVTSLALWVTPEAKCMQVYHALENKATDRFFRHLRSRFGHENVAVADTLRQILAHRSRKEPMIIGFIADQVPFWNNIHFWMPFLNHEHTPMFTGTERIARKYDMVVATLILRRESRGRYVAEFQLVTDDAKALPQYAVTEQAARQLETVIKQEPQYWLWSHNRWKRTYEEWLRRTKHTATGPQTLCPKP